MKNQRFFNRDLCLEATNIAGREKGMVIKMKHIKTLNTRDLKESMKKGGCGECQTSCQSACKTSCTVGNQSCEHAK